MRLTVTEERQVLQAINTIAQRHGEAARRAMELLAEIKKRQEEFEDRHEYVDGKRIPTPTGTDIEDLDVSGRGADHYGSGE